MAMARKPPSRLLKLGFTIPVWMYRAHLGSLLRGRVIVIAHRGRKSDRRYLSGLEVLVRSGPELPVFSAWGSNAGWYRNIEANGVEELWDGRERYRDVPFRRVAPDEAFSILAEYEQVHSRSAKSLLPRMLPGYDFSAESRSELSETGVIVAFAPTAPE